MRNLIIINFFILYIRFNYRSIYSFICSTELRANPAVSANNTVPYKTGMNLYKVADLSNVWVMADIYQVDLNSISEKIILSEDNLVISGISPRKYWDTNGKYLIYFKETGVKFVHYIYFKNIEN